jgi:hypothetical protein
MGNIGRMIYPAMRKWLKPLQWQSYATATLSRGSGKVPAMVYLLAVRKAVACEACGCMGKTLHYNPNYDVWLCIECVLKGQDRC